MWNGVKNSRRANNPTWSRQMCNISLQCDIFKARDIQWGFTNNAEKQRKKIRLPFYKNLASLVKGLK